MNKEFKLPDVGEGLTEADIVSWHVKPGDTIEDGQVIVEIETAKAVVELPSPYAGTVTGLLVEVLVEQGLPGVAAGEVVLGGCPEPGPERDQAGDSDDPGDDGEPAVPEAGASERAHDPGPDAVVKRC